MKLKMQIISVVCLFLMKIGYSKHVQTGAPSCPMDQYFDILDGACKVCLVCPQDYVIDVPCQGTQNTVCEKFTDFFRKFSPNFKFGSKSTDKPEEELTDTNQQEINGGASGIFEMSDEWYIISMVLLGILCLAGAAVTLYIVLACFICKKKVQDKEIIYQPEFISPVAATEDGILRNNDNYVTPSSFPVRQTTKLTSISEETEQQREPFLVNGNLYVNYEYIEPKDSLLLQSARLAKK